MFACFGAKVEAGRNENNMIRNGGMLLEKFIAFTNGRGHSIGRSFSYNDLKIATHNFASDHLIMDGAFVLYKGSLQDRPVIVKVYLCPNRSEGWMGDVVFSSQMKVHKNVLKLLGCCLESPVPILVFEYAEKLGLDGYILNREKRADFQPLPWKNRLKVAVDVANVIAYLHTAFSRPVVHRDIQVSSILLDGDYGAKVSDFSYSIAIPEGETHVKEAKGLMGYFAPEYHQPGGMFNEKIDVYSFGVLLIVLLTGQVPYSSFPDTEDESCHLITDINKCTENDRFEEVIDPNIVEEGPWPGKEQQLIAALMLALHCTSENPEDRPEITNVVKQLREMHRSLVSNYIHQH